MKLQIKRESTFVNIAVPYKIFLNEKLIGKLNNGKTMTIDAPDVKCVLKVEVTGHKLTLHSFNKNVLIFPEYNKGSYINCTISTQINWTGLLTLGLLQSIYRINILVEYL